MGLVTRQDELWKEDTGGTIRCHECDWAGQADTIAAALTLVRKHQEEAHCPPLEKLSMVEFLRAVDTHGQAGCRRLIEAGYIPKVVFAKALKAAHKGYYE